MPDFVRKIRPIMKTISTMLAMLLALTWSLAQDDWNFEKLLQAEQQRHRAKLELRSHPLAAAFDVKYHRFDWEIDPARRYIKGAVTTHFVTLEDKLDALYFDMSATLNVDSVVQRNTRLSFEKLPGNYLKLQLTAPLRVGSLDSVAIFYQGEPGNTGFGSFITATHGSNSTPVMWTLSEPYGAKDWRPCKDDLQDKADSIDVFVTTPPAYRAASNGRLLSETPFGGQKRYHWKHRYPIPAYLVAIAVTDYATYSDFVPLPDGRRIEVLNYIFPESVDQVRPQTVQTVKYLQLFNKLAGEYPYADEKYGHAQFGWGGGMEHTTMSFMGGFSSLLQAHELAHQWFGDQVTCGSWEDIWLNEGFATYFEGLTYEYQLRSGTWLGWLRGIMDQVMAQPGGSVRVDDTTSVNRIFHGRLSYNKGAMVLHMLRWKLGDDDFYAAIQHYLQDPALSFGFAKTADLQRHLERQSGQDLDEFLRDWYYGQGYPTYSIEWWSDPQNVFHVRIRQRQSHPTVSYFELPVPLQLKAPGKDTIVVADHQFDGQEFTFSPGWRVEEVVFDPKIWLIARVESITTATDEPAQQGTPKVEVYPSPAGDEIFLRQQGLPEGISAIRILNHLGQTVATHTGHLAGAGIPVSGLSGGMYRVELRLDSGAQVFATFVKK
jgi:aminopeptidase N